MITYRNIFDKLTRIEKRAKRKGWDFNLTADWLIDKLNKGRCEATGLPFKFDKTPYINPYYPTIDRINNNKGYTVNNCQVVCWMFNIAKADFDEDVFKYWAQHYVRKYEEKYNL